MTLKHVTGDSGTPTAHVLNREGKRGDIGKVNLKRLLSFSSSANRTLMVLYLWINEKELWPLPEEAGAAAGPITVIYINM